MKLSLFLVVALALFASAGWAGEPSIVLEAENPQVMRSPFQKVVTHSGKASGGAYLLLPWDQNKAKGSGSVVYQFNVETPGSYFLWARTYWTPDQGNSVRISVNSGFPKILGEDGTYSQWHWVGGLSRVALKAGQNTLTLLYGETGVRVDQFLLTQKAPALSGPLRKAIPPVAPTR